MIPWSTLTLCSERARLCPMSYAPGGHDSCPGCEFSFNCFILSLVALPGHTLAGLALMTCYSPLWISPLGKSLASLCLLGVERVGFAPHFIDWTLQSKERSFKGDTSKLSLLIYIYILILVRLAQLAQNTKSGRNEEEIMSH
jgi:hypothetical protein